jgi:hypothetical protein
MPDSKVLLDQAAVLRQRATHWRQTARAISLHTDRELLEGHAAAMDREAAALEEEAAKQDPKSI